MNRLELLNYAFSGVLEVWLRAKEQLNRNPTEEIYKIRFKKYDEDLDLIRHLISNEQEKEIDEEIVIS